MAIKLAKGIALALLSLTVLGVRPAWSQSALTAFVFIFVDSTIDVGQGVGDEYVRVSHTGGPAYFGQKTTVKTISNCVFEESKPYYFPADVNIPTRLITRWDFNKVFWNEAKINGGGVTVPGEKGALYTRLECPPSLRTCKGSESEGNEINNIENPASLGGGDRIQKALQYFVSNFCPGTKRKSAF